MFVELPTAIKTYLEETYQMFLDFLKDFGYCKNSDLESGDCKDYADNLMDGDNG